VIRRLTAILLVLVAGAACSSGAAETGGGAALVGTFRLTPGQCGSSTPTGTYFRMIQPGGTVAKGKYFSNPDSTCRDKSFTVERPGIDGGLVTGSFQPSPATAFNAHGDALADRITTPGSFTAIKFAISTNSTDPQTGKHVSAPRIVDNGGKLSGEIAAWTAAWNNLFFNQGSPKPDGSRPGLTTPVTGSYDPSCSTGPARS
jgi:hypothetical protein